MKTLLLLIVILLSIFGVHYLYHQEMCRNLRFDVYTTAALKISTTNIDKCNYIKPIKKYYECYDSVAKEMDSYAKEADDIMIKNGCKL